MKSYRAKTPRLIQNIFPKYTWSIANNKKEIFLTFDDGPHPEISIWVLEQLKKFNAKATFFCVGENISKYPKTFVEIVSQNHSIGNHTYNHLNGWKYSSQDYLSNFEKCESELGKYNCDQKLFRPPYGKISSKQAKFLIDKGHKIIMWDVLSGDFDYEITAEKCLDNVLNNTQSGSIIVFHDSEKSFTNLKITLPKTLKYFNDLGYQFKAIKM